jgi:hypothetical protein
MISPSRLKAKRMVYSIPCRAESFGGGTQQARSAAYIALIESSGFSSAALFPSLSDFLLSWALLSVSAVAFLLVAPVLLFSRPERVVCLI